MMPENSFPVRFLNSKNRYNKDLNAREGRLQHFCMGRSIDWKDFAMISSIRNGSEDAGPEKFLFLEKLVSRNVIKNSGMQRIDFFFFSEKCVNQISVKMQNISI